MVIGFYLSGKYEALADLPPEASTPISAAILHPIFGLQGTGGSCNVRGPWEPLGESRSSSGARNARQPRRRKRWNVDPSTCQTENNAVVQTATGKRLGYSALVEESAKFPVPVNPKPKDPKNYKYVDKPSPRIDSPEKSNGKVQFGIDVRLPGKPQGWTVAAT